MDEILIKHKWMVLFSVLIFLTFIGTIFIIKTSSMGNQNQLTESIQADQINPLLVEIKSLKEILASTEKKYNLAANLDFQNTNNTLTQEFRNELSSLIKIAIQEELNNLKLTDVIYDIVQNENDKTADITSLHTSSTQNDIEYDEQASLIVEDELGKLIENAIDNGVWTEENNRQFTAKSSQLKSEAGKRLLEKFADAVNDQQLKLSENAIPML